MYTGVKLTQADFTPPTPAQFPPNTRELLPRKFYSPWKVWAGYKTQPSAVAQCCTLRPLNFGTKKTCSRRPRNKIKDVSGSRFRLWHFMVFCTFSSATSQSQNSVEKSMLNQRSTLKQKAQVLILVVISSVSRTNDALKKLVFYSSLSYLRLPRSVP